MTENPDAELLTRFAQGESEEAFAAVVHLHPQPSWPVGALPAQLEQRDGWLALSAELTQLRCCASVPLPRRGWFRCRGKRAAAWRWNVTTNATVCCSAFRRRTIRRAVGKIC